MLLTEQYDSIWQYFQARMVLSLVFGNTVNGKNGKGECVLVYSCTHMMYSSDLFLCSTKDIACVFHVSAVPFSSAYSTLNITSLVVYPVVIL